MSGLDVPNQQSDFKIVTYKKKPAKLNVFRADRKTAVISESHFDRSTAVRRILEAKSDLVTSDFYASVLASLREALCTLNHQNNSVAEIVCFGLGKIGECMISRYQTAFLLCLKDLYKVKVYAYDPLFGKGEKQVLTEIGIDVLDENSEGKFVAREDLTLFFLPHCPKQLTNNLLWANWGLKLSRCVLLCNSFTNIIERDTNQKLAENAEFILNISSYTTEIAIINSFKYYDIFNDLGLHVFPIEELALIAQDFWDNCKEPKYADDIEFITNKLEAELS